ncbi:2-oxoglutarate and iron-dependent oxygenase domain-containing protein [Oleiagrimonas sp.]|jgi:isopenicillin N synthase-like dioxygenase|uniref:isopenicillin N synthase family dioxygenase n=1 Tax=Oleiagrimonas sp. TaxID=2010330 RepID=UPI00261FE71A|nr:2-oxoglutarate and iron-dependent oxygenase domain-containing protein [Oleiagrimonas sp.]MDA3914603.1 isopenicillin N synthase family oxygenase [Oleiagrimonas sp.]
MNHVPTLDIRRFETDREAFVDELGAAYREFGFCCIGGHGIAIERIAGAYDAFRRFFALPVEAKMKYHMPGTGGARGYTPFKVETAKDSQYPDLKEFWHIGREIEPDSRFAECMPPNLWPDEVPHMREYGYGLYQALDQLGARVLRALALHIDLPEDYFEDKIDQGNSILRPIHYPPVARGDIPNVRAGAHEDINFITLLVGASAAGLEVLTREGEWLPITTEGDAIVVNIGDMLQRLTNHVYPSTTHRVVNPPGHAARKPRYSVPFFLHPNPDVVLDPVAQCVSSGNPNRYVQSMTAHEYLMQRLREIGLI